MIFSGLYKKIDEFSKTSPQKVAIKCGKQILTYEELSRESARIAYTLYKTVSPNKNVALIMERSIEMVVSIIGAIKAGVVFVPIDAAYPKNRINYMLDVADCETIITKDEIIKKTLSISNCADMSSKVILLDREGTDLVIKIPGFKEIEIEDKFECIYNEMCYIYFTSGSTGKPKGILGKHSSLEQFIKWEINEFNIDNNVRVSQIISPSFDPYLRDIFVPLEAGGTLVIPESTNIITSPAKLINWIDEENITLMHMVKTIFINMMDEVENDDKFSHLKYILLSGESLKGIDIKKFYEIFKGRIDIINLYGPTETTLIKTFYRVKSNDASKINVPIGKPIEDTRIHILDNHMNKCHVGEVGEIYIESPYISYGYYKDEEKTKKVFIKNTFDDAINDVLYKTGDIGIELENGNYECLGRSDRQIKIDGIRIEPGEIENVIKSYFNVEEAIVISKKRSNGKVNLYLYYTCKDYLDADKVTSVLAENFQSQMIPSEYVRVKEMPLLINGKIDVKKLMNIESSIKEEKNKNTFMNEHEKKVVEIMADILRYGSIDVDDDFYKLGGNSIDASKIALKLYNVYNFEVLALDILKKKTPRKIAEYISKKKEKIYNPINKAVSMDSYPLTPIQNSIFVISKKQCIKTSYNISEIVEIDGQVNVDKLNQAFKRLIQEEEVFRTTFKFIDGEPRQVIKKEVDFNITLTDYSNRYKNEILEKEKIRNLKKEFMIIFNLEEVPLLKVDLIKVGESRYLLLMQMHHIICDGTSQELLKYKLSLILNNKNLNKSNIKYSDYSIWLNKKIQSEHMKKMKKFWLDIFNDNIPVLDVPADFNRPAIRTSKGDNIIYFLDKNLSKAIRKFSSNQSKSVYVIMLTAFAALLSKYTSQENIVIGSILSSRAHPDIEKMIGVFINTIPLKICIDQEKTFNEILMQVSNFFFKVMENQEYPFEEIVKDLKIKPSLSRNPIFDVMFIMQNMNTYDLKIRNAITKGLLIGDNVSKYDITLNVIDNDESICLNFEYATDLFTKSRIERMAKNYESLLVNIMENLETPICSVDIMPKEEKKVILDSFQKYTNSYVKTNKTFIDLFKKQVNKTPDNIAINFKNTSMSYRKLDIVSDYLADILSKQKLRSNEIIGIMVKRSPLVIISMIAILKAGFAYLPIDITYPLSRIKYMLEDSKCNLVISDCDKVENFEINHIDINLNDIVDCQKVEPINKSQADEIAYVIYTSGSTGLPKGVVLTNRNLLSFILSVKKEIEFPRYKKILSLTTSSFDIFLFETFLPLTEGLEVVLGDEDDQRNVNNIKKIMEYQGIDIVQMTPSRLNMITDSVDISECFKNLKAIVVGGEHFPSYLLNKLRILKNIRIYNLYGPTEATVWCSIKDLTHENNITIGKPFDNSKFYILNEHKQLQPIGIKGELYISGECISRGYLNKEDKTRKRFMQDPFNEGKTMYRTGDIGRWQENGEIELIGRCDSQVKLRGYRIELKEIEKCISSIPEIISNVCIIREDENRGRYLVGYYESKEKISISLFRKHLLSLLPDYMIPEVFIHMNKFPMTQNGKIDRGKLPKPKENIRPVLNSYYKKVTTETEKKIVEIWQEVLRINEIGVDDNFFELGGNSIILVKMHNKLEKIYTDTVNIVDIFSHPTIASLAKFICSKYETLGGLLDTIPLPQEYFEGIEKNDESNEYLYEFTSEVKKDLSEIGRNYKDLEKLMLGIYIFLLYKITKKEYLSIYVMVDSNKGIFSKVKININLFNSFQELKNYLSINVLNKNIYSITNIRNNKNNYIKNEISTIFSLDKSVSEQFFNMFDLVFEFSTICDMKIKWSFNIKKLNPEKIEELLNLYIALVEKIIKKEM
ncbi:amino acid adenylation domain-containing protein [Clostridium botulinum]|nr:amino acid adenylation domain-containing protein [Clostridium botulinum]